jgi:hypothetical protein
MDEYFRRMLEQRQAFERAADLLPHMRDHLGLGLPTDAGQMALARELATPSSLLGNLDAPTYERLVDMHRPRHDEWVQLTASLGLAGMRPSAADDLLRKGVMGELNAGRLYRDQTLAGAAEKAWASVSGVASAAEMLRWQQAAETSRAPALAALGMVDARDFAYRLAGHDEVAALAKQAIEGDRLTAYAFAGSVGLETLVTRMEAMDAPWLKAAHELESVSAFAHLQAIGDLVHDVAPYAEGAAAYLRADLGDWRDTLTLRPSSVPDADERSQIYVAQGFNTELTAFTPSAFLRGAFIARLLEVEEEELSGWCDADSDGFARNQAAFNRLQHFEFAIRKYIAETMWAAFGDTWMQRRLPAGMLDKWKGKRDAAVHAGAQEQPLINYADFTDYLPIIEKKDNWRELYQKIFQRPEDIKESLQRMYPVRIATMHARVITLDDSLLLMVETKRVIKAFATWQ